MIKSKGSDFADVAKLADALDLGSSARKGVGVQVPPSAPNFFVPEDARNTSQNQVILKI
jgi:hypothetical protein